MNATKLPAAKDMPRKFDDLLSVAPPRAIHDERDYEHVQELIDRLTSIPKLSKGQADDLETWTVLFEDYEREHHAIDTSDISGLDSLRCLMEQNDMSASDLGRLLGDRSLGSRILRGERELSKDHFRRLCDRFKVRPELFMD